MAIEDALVLATLLAEYWDKPDGHVEAFYLYEVRRGVIYLAAFGVLTPMPCLEWTLRLWGFPSWTMLF